MKRTQLYIEEDIFKMLERLSRERTVSVSELVREAVRKTYGAEKPPDADFILKEAAGVWKDRKEMRFPDRYVRRMRKDTRRDRLGLK